jgi:hypothetical protein
MQVNTCMSSGNNQVRHQAIRQLADQGGGSGLATGRDRIRLLRPRLHERHRNNHHRLALDGFQAWLWSCHWDY